jgi:hypothetical protein
MKKINFGDGHWRRTGGVAKLPMAVRKEVNTLLEDGRAFAAVAEWLTEKGHKGVGPEWHLLKA